MLTGQLLFGDLQYSHTPTAAHQMWQTRFFMSRLLPIDAFHTSLRDDLMYVVSHTSQAVVICDVKMLHANIRSCSFQCTYKLRFISIPDSCDTTLGTQSASQLSFLCSFAADLNPQNKGWQCTFLQTTIVLQLNVLKFFLSQCSCLCCLVFGKDEVKRKTKHWTRFSN